MRWRKKNLFYRGETLDLRRHVRASK